MKESKEAFVVEAELVTRTIINALADGHENYHLEILKGVNAVVIVVSGGQDLGKIIGKQGRTAAAIRVILNAVAAKYKQNFIFDIAG